MPQEFSLLGFVPQLHTIDRDLHEVGPAIIARACEMVAKQAKSAIGKTHELWPPLKPATIARKLRGNTPLLETGEMRDSIEWTVHGLEGEVGSMLLETGEMRDSIEWTVHGLEGEVGSDNDKAVW